MTNVLIIDDDDELCELVAEYLSAEGYGVASVHDGDAGLTEALSGKHDLAILDVMLPRMNGFEVLRNIRERSRMPVLMLTARGDDTERIVGLEIGADDYLPKPFNPRELLARLRAILRRRKPSGPPESALHFGRLEIDRGARVVRLDGEERSLTAYQFALLVALAENAGRIMSRESLMDLVKGEPLEAFDRSIDVHISRIRAAIED